jgi:hypothetical protein
LARSPYVIPQIEPQLDNFFDMKNIVPPPPGLIKTRADIEISNPVSEKSFVLDLVFTESTIKLTPDGYNHPGDAAKHGARLKLAEYAHWDLANSANEFVVFNVETFGVLGDAAKKFIKRFISDDGEDRINEIKIYQRLSVALHTVLAKATLYIKQHLSHEMKPPFPLRFDPNDLPPIFGAQSPSVPPGPSRDHRTPRIAPPSQPFGTPDRSFALPPPISRPSHPASSSRHYPPSLRCPVGPPRSGTTVPLTRRPPTSAGMPRRGVATGDLINAVLGPR